VLDRYYGDRRLNKGLFRFASQEDRCGTAATSRAHHDEIGAALSRETVDRVRDVRGFYAFRHHLNTIVTNSRHESGQVISILAPSARFTAGVGDNLSIEVDVKRGNLANACN
jgi:hypothetical protein